MFPNATLNPDLDLAIRAAQAGAAIISVIQSAFPDDEILGGGGGWVNRTRPSSHVPRQSHLDHRPHQRNHEFRTWRAVLWHLHRFMGTQSAGGGAHLNGRPIRVSGITDPELALLGTGFPYRDLDLLDDYMLIFRRMMRETQGVRRPGSASLDFCYVATGRYDGFYEYGLSPWDVAAGGLIVQEAGGLVTDWTSGDNWLHGKRIIAANSAIHEYLSKCIIEDVHPDRLEHPRHSSS